ncbi:MerR family transcriptional regulator [Kribbella sp. NPDC023855]|uniref:MerR family transcriptional regulator n=1 Tax=Kribbella sp. NPDC023855 TaxID=3154698 RepID=UPI0033D71B25
MTDAGAGPGADLSRAVWPVGRVAAMLGISAMTLRSWERRYGIGPSQRSQGQHRRYTQADVDRLRRMQLLIQQGTSPVDAARLSRLQVPAPRDPASAELDTLLREAEVLRLPALDELLDGSLARSGVRRTWTDLVAPAFRQLGQRFQRDGDCTDIEVVLARSFEGAVERYLNDRRLRRNGVAPVLLAVCPNERHTMPMTVLEAVLAERAQPVVLIGPDAGEVALMSAAQRTAPRVVVLWSLRRQAGQAALRTRLLRQGFAVESAGPGWPRSVRTLTDLEQAAERLITRARRH